jgi:hypothetical protein
VPSQVRISDVSSAVRSEYARILAHGRDDLLAVGFNAALVTVCWFLLPDSIRNWLFVLHGALVFPFILEMWMLGDTPATNVAGRDAVRAASQLDDPSALRLWLRAKHIVLTSFIGPIAAIVAMVIAALQQEYMTGAAIAITLLFLPSRRVERRGMDRTLAALSPPEAALALAASFRLASSVASVGVLLVLPYLVVPLIGIVLLSPTLIIWIIAHQGYPPHEMAPAGLWTGTAVSIVVSLIVFAWAPGVASKIARRRRDQLHDYLSDPEHG